MNVLESLHIVSRSAKNRYAWHGRTKLAETLAILKKVGEEHRYSQQMQQIRQRLLEEERDFEEEEEEEKENREQEVEDREQGHKELFFVELPGVEFKAGEDRCLLTSLAVSMATRPADSPLVSSASVNSRKDKSLRVMSQKFVMLFLVSDPRVVSLDVAAKILIGEDHGADQDKSKFKSECGTPASSLFLTSSWTQLPLKRDSFLLQLKFAGCTTSLTCCRASSSSRRFT